MKDYPETHQTGYVSIENSEVIRRLMLNSRHHDLGIQIAKDGRVWVCIDGVAFIRFKPDMEENKANE